MDMEASVEAEADATVRREKSEKWLEIPRECEDGAHLDPGESRVEKFWG